MTVKITEEHLGAEATREQAQRAVELLNERGYDVKYGDPGRDERAEDHISNRDWSDVLDTVSKESYS